MGSRLNRDSFPNRFIFWIFYDTGTGTGTGTLNILQFYTGGRLISDRLTDRQTYYCAYRHGHAMLAHVLVGRGACDDDGLVISTNIHRSGLIFIFDCHLETAAMESENTGQENRGTSEGYGQG
jgi:hypothetical protein